VRVDGEAEIVKLNALVTVSVTAVFRCRPPPFPDTVIGYVPVAVLAPTIIVIVDEPAPGAGIVEGLKLTVVPLGAPVADRAIELLNPALITAVMVEVPWFPCGILKEAGDAEIVKLAGAVTVSVTVVACCTPPPMPVTVIG
jgi:hypothetical protein